MKKLEKLSKKKFDNMKTLFGGKAAGGNTTYYNSLTDTPYGCAVEDRMVIDRDA